MAQEAVTWQVETKCASTNKFSRYNKKHSAEFSSLFANLEKIMRLLRTGQKIGGFRVGFFRSEGEGVYRIGQSGVPSAKESRLYVFPDEQSHTVFVLAIGDKDSQSADINEAKQIVRAIREELSATPTSTPPPTTGQ